MFRRRASEAPAPESTPSLAGKGRPTPTRKSAEAARAARVKPPKNSREARKLDRQRASAQRLEARRAAAEGDPRYLPARDRGPVRKWVRDFVDARWTVNEWLLPGTGAAWLFGILYHPLFTLFYVLLASALMDSLLIARGIRHGVRERFPDEPLKGLRMYGVLRSTQFRRLRIPKPTVPRQSILVGRRKTKEPPRP
ncbi:MAG TPA: DUF3043 domain-containing protein [Actinomycetes bacterium]|nr:DUF3043 domain-containing protein [Actinomycetes bacterium]